MSLYRISRRSEISAESAETISDAQAYFDRALRLIPADVVAAYLTVRGFWMPNSLSSQPKDVLASAVLNWYLPIVGFIATVFLRIMGTSKTFAGFNDIQWKTVIISGIAFVLWVSAIQNPVFNIQLDPRVAPSLLILFTLIVPIFQKGN